MNSFQRDIDSYYQINYRFNTFMSKYQQAISELDKYIDKYWLFNNRANCPQNEIDLFYSIFIKTFFVGVCLAYIQRTVRNHWPLGG